MENNGFFTNGSSALKLDEFAAHLNECDYSLCTKRAYIDSVKSFSAHGFTVWTPQNAVAYRDMLVAEKKKPRSINLMIAALNNYAKWQGQDGIKGVKINDEPFAVDGMEIDDYHALLDNLLKDEKYHWYIAIKLLASTGMRIGEATSVTYGDFRRGYATVWGKGGKERTVFFSHTLRETLYMFIKDKPDSERMIPYGTHYVREAFRRIKKRYGLECNTNPHEYRHFFARELYDKTNDAALLKGLLGHESIVTTSHYIKKTGKQAMRMLAKNQNW